MAELPRLKTLVKRHKDDPFALIGINTDAEKTEYRKKITQHEVTWRDAWQGSPGGPLPRRWGVRFYPMKYLIDHEGRVQYVNPRGEALDAAIAKLVAQAKQKR